MEKYRMDTSKGIEFGLYSIGDHVLNPHNGEKISAEQRIHELIDTAKLADEAGLDVFAVGESHQTHFTTQAHTVILGAIAQATKNIKIASSATIISTSDPVRVYEDFATIDLISNGRAEIVAGRGSRIGGYSLLGYDVNDYEELFEEKMDLLLKINQEEHVTWNGQFRAPLTHASVIPRAKNNNLPIWRAVGGPAINFKGSVDAYREAAVQSGFNPASLPVATTSLFYTAKNSQDAFNEYYPHINAGMLTLRGGGYPKQQFTNAVDYRDALMVGSPQQIIEKMLYQYELFGQQRFMAQIDFGGVPLNKIEKNIELIATEILPSVRKHTAK
ncbi:LLM class flavin-dependent oxidoreductase [Bacillus mobilis]|uniref:LLM class flavin-dependent oxidoreductase n=1 Tax=Bacillus mobilis TaxID=2026190 RepID=UPI0036B52BA9